MSTKKKRPSIKPDTDFNTGDLDKLDIKTLAVENRFTSRLFRDRKLSRRRVALSRLRRKVFAHVWVARGVILSLILLVLVGGIFLGVRAVKKTSLGYFLGLANNFVFPPQNLVPTINGRTNILILGKSGTGQDSPDLTDTMIMASISEIDRKISLVSIPRDIWIPSMRAKINTAYYYGKQKGEGSYIAGIVLAKSTVEEVVGVPIQYAVVVDFSGFERTIDEIGGIDVVVDRSFVDYQYPVAGREADLCGGDPTFACRYETVSFNQGLQHMNGETALKFVRSRHAIGDEGSDLARALRQQKVIKAIIAKVLTPQIFLSFSKDSHLLAIVNSSVETDIVPEAAAVVARWVVDGRNNVITHAIPDQFLYNPPISPLYDNQFVFVPKKGDWSELQSWVKQNLP